MGIKQAMKTYFDALESLYKERYGTLPTVSYCKGMEQSLVVSDVDKNGDVQWRVADAPGIEAEGLCNELKEFFGSYYFFQLRGCKDELYLDFAPMANYSEAKKAAESALSEGKAYTGKDMALLATATLNGNDDLVLMYNQPDGRLMLFDIDTGQCTEMNMSLSELVGTMEALL